MIRSYEFYWDNEVITYKACNLPFEAIKNKAQTHLPASLEWPNFVNARSTSSLTCFPNKTKSMLMEMETFLHAKEKKKISLRYNKLKNFIV